MLVPTSHHQANSRVERTLSAFIKNLRRKLLDDSSFPNSIKNWPDFVVEATASYNNSHCKAIGTTPFFLLFGRHFNDSVNNLIDPPTFDNPHLSTIQEYRRESISNFHHNWNIARETMQEAARVSNERVNKSKKISNYHLGDQVMFWTEKVSTTNIAESTQLNHLTYHKLVPKWIGPCTVTGILSDEVYLIHSPRHLAFEVSAHVQFLKPFDPSVDYRKDRTPPIVTLLATPDLTVEAPDMSAHDIFDRNFDRRIYRDDDIPSTPKAFKPITDPAQDDRLHRYFRIPDDVDPSVTVLYKTFYINYRNDLATEAIWVAPMKLDARTDLWRMAGPTRFISLSEYVQYFHSESKSKPFH